MYIQPPYLVTSGDVSSGRLTKSNTATSKDEVGSCRRDGRFSQMVDHQTEGKVNTMSMVAYIFPSGPSTTQNPGCDSLHPRP